MGTRVATSFVRFGQLELFAQRGELDLLAEIAEHALEREYAHLKETPETRLSCRLLLRLFDEVCTRQAALVAEWQRVGYCQGNMNSDNSALGGVTLDYGPFAFMEKYEPYYNPWVGGGRPYSYGMQMEAAATNLGEVAPGGARAGLAFAFAELALHLLAAEERRGGGEGEGDQRMSKAEVLASLRRSTTGFRPTYQRKHDDNCRAKLGLAVWGDEAQWLWAELLRLMSSCSGQGPAAAPGVALGEAAPATARGWRLPSCLPSCLPWESRDPIDPPPPPPPPPLAPTPLSGGVDFTLLFRSLGRPEIAELALAELATSDGASAGAESDGEGGAALRRGDDEGPSPSAALRALLQPAALDDLDTWPAVHVREWEAWALRYWSLVRTEASGDERTQGMAAANPKYILRNWMAAEAYEAAEKGDYSVVRSLVQRTAPFLPPAPPAPPAPPLQPCPAGAPGCSDGSSRSHAPQRAAAADWMHAVAHRDAAPSTRAPHLFQLRPPGARATSCARHAVRGAGRGDRGALGAGDAALGATEGGARFHDLILVGTRLSPLAAAAAGDSEPADTRQGQACLVSRRGIRAGRAFTALQLFLPSARAAAHEFCAQHNRGNEAWGTNGMHMPRPMWRTAVEACQLEPY